MRDLGLFEQYLLKLRQDKLQLGHSTALNAHMATDLVHVVARAREAELVSHILEALRALANDPGQFIKEYLPK